MQICYASNGAYWCKVAVLFLTLCLMKRGSAISFEEFVGYPFNEANDYSIFPHGIDHTEGLPIPVRFPYFGSKFSYAHIDYSGYISLLEVNSRVTLHQPMDFPFSTNWSAVVAPYWYNISNRDIRNGSIYYKNVTRDTDVDVTCKIDSLATSHLCGFATTWALIVTWNQVGYDENNTFQVVIATDEVQSIAVFNYAENGINYAGGAIAGYNVGHSDRYFKLPGSLSEDIKNIDNKTGNTGRKGQWVFLLDDPSRIDGFTASSSTSTSITLSWSQTTATIYYYKLTLHSVTGHTSEQLDLFCTVTSYTFHNLSPSTAYSATITAVSKGRSGPSVSVDVTTQGAPVSPLAVATGVLGSLVAIGIVAVPLLVCFGCRQMNRRKGKGRGSAEYPAILNPIHRAERAPDGNFDCEFQDNVAYVTTTHNGNSPKGCGTMKEEEEKSEGNNMSANGNIIELKPVPPQLPFRQYLLEKEGGPTVFATIPVFDEVGFKTRSGWYNPTVEDVISRKLGVDVAVFADLGSGVYLLRHRSKEQTKWVGLSPDLCRTLCGIFFQLYRKKHSELNPLEVELKFFSPLAADWDIKVWAAEPQELVLERAKKIMKFKTLKPFGLNNSLDFTNREAWAEFTGWFAAKRRQHS